MQSNQKKVKYAKKYEICTRGEWSEITAEMEEQVSNALFTTCIANGALILKIKSSNCVFVRRLPNIEGDNAASDPNLTNLSAFVQNIYIFCQKKVLR